jgi:uncharacterized repeat protein (TIGR03806 family)
MTRYALAALALCVLGAAKPLPGVNIKALLAPVPAATLSTYRLFADGQGQIPNARVVPYVLASALYADDAQKQRFVFVPDGTPARYAANGVFDFPVGTVLVKSFGYPEGAALKLIETRLLIHQAQGWVALPYVWNETQTEATLQRIGARRDVTWRDAAGTAQNLRYAVPNQNQCKGCHAVDNVLTPIGPKARNLNVAMQLHHWQQLGLVSSAPADAPRVPNYADATAPLADRARAYLDINCAHCHNPQGPASNSGLDLSWENDNATARGVYKRPVAAGRGAGNLEFSIVPGKPDESILLHRMQSAEPGIAMPELGRSQIDTQGTALIRAYIASLKPE